MLDSLEVLGGHRKTPLYNLSSYIAETYDCYSVIVLGMQGALSCPLTWDLLFSSENGSEGHLRVAGDKRWTINWSRISTCLKETQWSSGSSLSSMSSRVSSCFCRQTLDDHLCIISSLECWYVHWRPLRSIHFCAIDTPAWSLHIVNALGCCFTQSQRWSTFLLDTAD